jgi:hypothetical protein
MLKLSLITAIVTAGISLPACAHDHDSGGI